MLINIIEYYKRVKITSGCWVWVGSKNKAGYGAFSIYLTNRRGTPTKSSVELAHRVAVFISGRKIPDGFNWCVDHICKNKSCVNPAHLRVVTRAINNTENHGGPAEKNKAKTHCPSGHEYNAANTYKYKNSRQCKKCVTLRPAYIKKYGEVRTGRWPKGPSGEVAK